MLVALLVLEDKFLVFGAFLNSNEKAARQQSIKIRH